MNTCLAVDIGGTKIAAALIREKAISKRTQLATPASKSPEALTAALSELLVPLSHEADYVAIASTGIIDNGILTALNPDNLGGLNHYPLKEITSELTGLPVVMINDAQAAAWAEYQALNQSASNMAFITVSTGIGAGLIQNGTLTIGSRGIAGHAGHMLADPHGPICGCGRQGCIESIASGTAIGEAGKAYFGDGCDGKTVYNKFLAKDRQATKIIQRSANATANLIADLTICLDLDVVALGGSVGLADKYLELVKMYLSSMPAVYSPQLMPARTGADAGLLGVAQWAETQIFASQH